MSNSHKPKALRALALLASNLLWCACLLLAVGPGSAHRGTRTLIFGRHPPARILLAIGMGALAAWLTVFLARSFNSRFKRALVVAASLTSPVLVLGCVEVYLFLCDFRDYSARASTAVREAQCETIGKIFDSRNKLELVLAERQKGNLCVPFMCTANFIEDRRTFELTGQSLMPLAGISNARTILCNEECAWMTYLSDEHGFWNPPGIYAEGTVDIVTVGDSYTQGYCVRYEDTLAATLRKQGGSVLNLGLGGCGPLTELATIREYASLVKPKQVIWLYCETNDLKDLALERTSSLLKYLDPTHSQDLFHKQPEVRDHLLKYLETQVSKAAQTPGSDGFFTAKTTVLSWRECLTLNRTRKRIARYVGSKTTSVSRADQIVDLLDQIIRVARNEVEARGGRFLFVYLPSFKRAFEPLFPDADRQLILGNLRVHGTAILDITPLLEMHPDPRSLFPFRTANHFNAAGYALVAAAIGRELRLR